MDWIQINQVIDVLLCIILARYLYKDIKNQLKGKNKYEIISKILVYIIIIFIIILLTGGLSL